jgi:hypothetical protein
MVRLLYTGRQRFAKKHIIFDLFIYLMRGAGVGMFSYRFDHPRNSTITPIM